MKKLYLTLTENSNMTKDTLIGEGVGFDHYARITGYISKVSKFNNAKKDELKDRVKHDPTKFVCECGK